jgi:uncharacterized protein YwgA
VGNPRQYALISYLADLEGGNGRLGKKAVQKFVHILASLTGRSYGYQFSFYTYGPFSRALASDLDIAESMGLVRISYNSFENSYSIGSTEKSKAFVEKFLSDDQRKQMASVWRKFSGRTARELELISTILFISQDEGAGLNSAGMRIRVKELKPKYDVSEIVAAQRELAAL